MRIGVHALIRPLNLPGVAGPFSSPTCRGGQSRHEGVNPEWRLDKAQNFLGEVLASSRVGSGGEDDLP
jgi:hypothetical protein